MLENNKLNINDIKDKNDKELDHNELMYLKSENIFMSKEFSYLENNKILNTLRSQQSLNTDEIRNLPIILIDLQEALNKSNHNVIELREKLKDLIIKDKGNKETIKDLSERNLKLHQKNNTLLSNAVKYEKREEEFSKILDKADNDMNQKLENINNLEDICNEQENNIKDLQSKLNSVIEENNILSGELVKERKTNETLRRNFESIDDNINEIDVFKNTVLKLREEVSSFIKKNKELETINSNLKKDNLVLGNKIKHINEVQKQERKENLILKEENYKLKEQCEESQEILKENEMKYMKEIKDIHNIKQKLISYEARINLLVKENEALKEKNKNLILNYEDLNNKNNKSNQIDYKLNNTNSLYFESILVKNLLITIFEGIIESSQLEDLEKEINYSKSSFEEIKKSNNFDVRKDILKFSKLSLTIAQYLKEAYEYPNINYKSNNNNQTKLNSDGNNRDLMAIKDKLEAMIKENNYIKQFNQSLQSKLYNELTLRRIVHNKYMKLRGNLRVMCRIRPFLENEVDTSKVCKFSIDSDYSLNVCNDNFNKKFELDYVFDRQSSQNDVYSEISFLTKSVLSGNNFCVFSYGQTCSGKTFTVQGNKRNPGMILFTIKEIFELFDSIKLNKNENTQYSFDNNTNKKYDYDYYNTNDQINKGYNDNQRYESKNNNNLNMKSQKKYNTISDKEFKSFTCNAFNNETVYTNNQQNNSNVFNQDKEYVSYLINNINNIKAKETKLQLSVIEIYNENIYSLLSESQNPINIYENNNDGTIALPDLQLIEINSLSEGEKIIKIASKLRQTSNTVFNERSSRSHLIYSLVIKIVDVNDNIIRSKINFVDLAGSERLSRNKELIDETSRKELSCIHLSLNSLANVLNAIAVKQNHIPYRNSKLTHFLKDCLTDNFNILLMLHISPNQSDIGETCSTLEFGTRFAKLCKYKFGGKDK